MSWPEGWDRGPSEGKLRRSPPEAEQTQVLGGLPDQERRTARATSSGIRFNRMRPPRSFGWRRRLLLIGGVTLALILVLAGGLVTYVTGKLRTVDALADYSGRPAETPGQDWLIVGSDSRADLSAADRKKLRTGSAVGQRTDTIMLLHVGDNGATLVSLPRDSFVRIPEFTTSKGRSRGGQDSKLNTAYAIGGPALLARTVEQITNIRLDHYVEVGFGGFVKIVDSVGGVDLCLKQPIRDRDSGARLKAGCQTLDGPRALSFVRARKFDPRSDLGRVDRQQQFLRALTKKMATPSVALNPVTLKPVTDASLAAVTVDRDTGAVDLARLFLSMRRFSGGDGVTTTVPVGDPDFRPGGGLGSTVKWDRSGAAALFGALREDAKVDKPATG